MFNILNCNTDIFSCCSDYGLATLLSYVKKFFNIITLVAPIVLLIMVVFQLAKMAVNPDEKKHMKALINKFIAIFVIFLSPMTINVLLGLLPTQFSLGACWQAAEEVENIIKLTPTTYIDTEENRKPVTVDPNGFDPGSSGTTNSSSSSSNSSSSSSTSTVAAKGFWWPIAKQHNSLCYLNSGRKYKSSHRGIDISSSSGKKGVIDIIASYDGEVVVAYNDVPPKYDNAYGMTSSAVHGGYGNYVVIKHNYNGSLIYTYYAHMTQSVQVKVGDKVKAGDVLGKMGSSGNSTGTHLHFEIRAGSYSRTYKSENDPLNYVKLNYYP